ncbi:MAG: serine hydrolase domain-containing protein [Microthrixaceae bacterium]
MTEISGVVEPGFERVSDAFEANFAEHGEVGASVCVYVDGQRVVDLVGGERTDGTPYDESTLQLVFSSTKGATAACAHLLAQRGELDLHAPVATYWPEFAAKGKGDVPVSWLLSHKVGLPDTEARLSYEQMLDWDTVAAALADSAPLWEPGTQHGYHAVTYGWLVGEVVRRVSGRSLGEYFAEEIAGPLGLEFWIGLPPEQVDRVSQLIPMAPPEGLPMMAAEEGLGGGDGSAPKGLIEMLDMLLGPGNLAGRALAAPGGAAADQDIWNDPRTWAAQIPAANGITNARGLARMYAGLVGEVDGVRLLDEATLNAAIEPQVEGPDAVLVFPIPFALGFMRHSDMSPMLGGRSFGHYGAGGSVGLADPERRISVGYAMNQMHFGLAGDPRTAALLAAVDAAVQ